MRSLREAGGIPNYRINKGGREKGSDIEDTEVEPEG